MSADCRAPVEEVWKLLFDPARVPDWWAGIETVRKDAPGEFTQWPTGYPDFPMAQKLRASMTHDQLHDFAAGSEAGKPLHVRKTPSVTRTASTGTPLGPHFAQHGFMRRPMKGT